MNPSENYGPYVLQIIRSLEFSPLRIYRGSRLAASAVAISCSFLSAAQAKSLRMSAHVADLDFGRSLGKMCQDKGDNLKSFFIAQKLKSSALYQMDIRGAAKEVYSVPQLVDTKFLSCTNDAKTFMFLSGNHKILYIFANDAISTYNISVNESQPISSQVLMSVSGETMVFPSTPILISGHDVIKTKDVMVTNENVVSVIKNDVFIFDGKSIIDKRMKHGRWSVAGEFSLDAPAGEASVIGVTKCEANLFALERYDGDKSDRIVRLEHNKGRDAGLEEDIVDKSKAYTYRLGPGDGAICSIFASRVLDGREMLRSVIIIEKAKKTEFVGFQKTSLSLEDPNVSTDGAYVAVYAFDDPNQLPQFTNPRHMSVFKLGNAQTAK